MKEKKVKRERGRERGRRERGKEGGKLSLINGKLFILELIGTVEEIKISIKHIHALTLAGNEMIMNSKNAISKYLLISLEDTCLTILD